ncbi:MAG: redoxin domain-containing protein [Clostridiales bacterium]|nr:redoxin domain-containing protein [Clostridiales bacterium]
MKRIRKTFTILVMALVIALTAILPAACGDGDPEKKPNGGNGDVKYTVKLEYSGGDAFADTLIIASGANLSEPLFERTNSAGEWSFTAPKGTYNLKFDVPEGFSPRSGTIDSKNPNVTFKLKGSLITDKEAPANKLYSIGDVMYDFSFTDTQGKTSKLSEVFQTKRAVMLNFWFANCDPCVSEFPGMETVYEEYKDNLEIIAFSRDETSAIAEAFRTNSSGFYGWDELTFRVVGKEQPCTSALLTSFSVNAFPTSVMIDREGVICFIVAGSGSEEAFRAEFERYTKPDGEYEQNVQFPGKYTAEKPNIPYPSGSKIAAALNAEGFEATYFHDANEYNWPWIITEDGKGIMASNVGKISSYALLYAEFEAEAGQIIAFDYKTSTEEGADLFAVYIDGEIMQLYSGVMNDYKTCYAYVPKKDGKYTLALAYLKDDSKFAGDDTVYVKNMRFADEVGERTEILYRAATGIDAQGDYSDYATVVYNATDGYYHVGSADGPLLVADLLNYSKWADHSAYNWVENGAQVTADLDGDGKEENYTDALLDFVTVAFNSEKDGKLAVTSELKDCLIALVQTFGNKKGNKDEWLDLCYYYEVYGGAPGEILGDPAAGLATYNAFDGKITERGATPVKNSVVKTHPIIPRGIWYKVVPEKTTIYRIYSIGDVDTYVWLANDKGVRFAENNNDDNPTNENPYNFSITRLFKAGEPFFVLVDFNNIDTLGSFEFIIEDLGATGTLWTPAADGAYEAEIDENGQMTGAVKVAGAVEYVLGDDGCYHVKNEDGTPGPLLYLNVLQSSMLFPEHSIETMINIPYYYCKVCGSKYPTSVKEFEEAELVFCFCGNTNKSAYEKKDTAFILPTGVMRDPQGNILTFNYTSIYDDGTLDYSQDVPMYYLNTDEDISSYEDYLKLIRQYGIEFGDYTATVRKYVEDARAGKYEVKDENEVGGKVGGAYGDYVPATKELVDIVQMFILFGDYSLSPQLENTWLMMANYFQVLA